ncbi:hypothetical protein KY285_019158 [Solanum tuberosum]|nr:hypothetical protein KY285_019158 [Solanum tuberosum]
MSQNVAMITQSVKISTLVWSDPGARSIIGFCSPPSRSETCFSCFPVGFCWLVVWRSENWWPGGHLLVVFSLGDGGLGFGGLKCGFTTGFWRGEGAWNWQKMEKKCLAVVTGK